MFCKNKKRLLVFNLALILIFVMPLFAFADTDIKIRINDPDRSDVSGQEGNTVYSVLSAPQVGLGENRELGTMRATGKPGIAVPVAQGQKVQITLPVGISYMQIPNQENYRNYVEWPSSVNGQANQIADQGGKPGMAFVAGSPRSLTLQVENLNTSAPVMVLDFVFNKSNYSMVRVSSILEEADKYRADTNGKVTRLEYFKLMQNVSIISASGPLIYAEVKPDWEAGFVDLKDLSAVDLGKISLLLEEGWVCGYPGGKLQAGQYISRAEAVSLAGKLFSFTGKKAVFKDAIPTWATAGIDSAVSGGIVEGYSDGTFHAEKPLSKSEALSIVQNCLESYSRQNRLEHPVWQELQGES